VRIARLLSPEHYGSYIYILTAVGIAQTVAVLGLRHIIIREIARKHEYTSYIARQTFPLLFLTGCAAGLGLVVYLAFFGILHSSLILLFCFLLVLSQGIWSFAESLAFGREQMQFSSALTVFSSFLWAVLIFSLPKDWFSVVSVLCTFAFSQSIRALAYLIFEYRHKYFSSGALPIGETVYSIRQLLHQSMPVFGTNLLTIPTTQLPILFLGQYSGMNEVGQFGIGNRLVIPISLIFSTMLTAFYPPIARAYENSKIEFSTLAGKTFVLLSIVGLVVCCITSMFSKEIILILFGDNYGAAVPVFALQTWMAFILSMFGFLGILFLSSNNEKLMLILSVANAIIIGTVSFLGAMHHAFGLAMYSWVGLVVGFGIHWFILKKRIGISMSQRKEITVVCLFIGLSIIAMVSCEWQLLYRLILLVSITAFIILSIGSRDILRYLKATLRDIRSLTI
jgi:O-antigen/teichoic acid export membrane protein